MSISKIRIGNVEHELETTISNVSGLQDALNEKANINHTHDYVTSWNDLEDRPFYAEDPVVTTETILEETTFDGFSDGMLQVVTNFTLVDGAECVVTWDGVEHTSICKKEYADGETTFLIGNLALFESGEDNGQPFAIASIQKYGLSVMISNNIEATSHTVKIVSTTTTQEIHKLDNKYINAEWMAEPPIGYETVFVFDETTVATMEVHGIGVTQVIFSDTTNINNNSLITLVLDGVEYVSAVILSDGDSHGIGDISIVMNGAFAGNIPYFGIFEKDMAVFYFSTPGEHTISFKVDNLVYNQLPAHYIEDALAAVKPNITGAASTIVEANLTLDKALISDSSGKVAASSVTSTELGYLSGVTENVQDQFNTQTTQAAALAKLTMPGSLKWDGFIGDKEYVVVGEDSSMRICYVHISDYDPIILSDYVGETLEGFVSIGGLVTGDIEEDTIMPLEFTVNEDMSIIAEFFVFAPVDGFALEGIVFPKKGWYLITQSVVSMGYEIPLMYINVVNIPLVNFPDNNGDSASKYFESVEEKTYLGDTLTWDGNVDGRVCIEHQFVSGDIVINAKYVKMSDSVLSVTDFVNGFTSLYNNGTQQQKSYEDIINSDMINSDGFISIRSITGVPTDNYNILGVTFPEAGIYFGTDGTSYPTSLTIPGYNFVEIEPSTVIKTEHLPKALQFGEITKTSETGGDTLTWDGKSGMVSGDSVIAKFSDRAPTRDDLLKGFTVTIESSNGSETVVVTSENMNNHLSALTSNRMFIFANRSNPVPLVVFTYGDNDFALEPGIYFYNTNGQNYCSSLTINGYTGFPVTTTELVKVDPKYLHQPDWNQADETAPDFLKNKPFYEEVQYSDILTVSMTEADLAEVIESGKLVAETFLKCSDSVVNMRDLENGLSLNCGGEIWNIPAEEVSENAFEIAEGAILVAECFVSVDDQAVGVDLGGITFTDKGLYVNIFPVLEVQSLSISINNYQFQSVVINKIDKKYLPAQSTGGKILYACLPTENYLYTDVNLTNRATNADVPDTAAFTIGNSNGENVLNWFTPISTSSAIYREHFGYTVVQIANTDGVHNLYTAEYTPE